MATEFYFKTVAGQQVDFTNEVIIRAFEPLRPFPQNPSAIVYRARLTQLRSYYTRPSFNTPHPNLPQVYFSDDTDFQDRTSGVWEWTRTWVTLPSSWNDFESYAYTYPGLSWNLSTTGRSPFTRTVTAKIVRDYFLVGALPTFSAGFAQYDDFANAAWAKTSATGSANSNNIPVCAGGTNTAAKIAENVAAGPHLVAQAASVGTGQVFGSVFLKTAGRDKGLIRLNDGGEISNARFDLSTGNMWQTTGNWAGITAVGEGWSRVWTSGVAGNASVSLEVVLLNSNYSATYTGDGTSGMFMWRGQLALGTSQPHATVPPTTGVDNVNYPINSADQIPVKNATLFLYNPNGLGVPNGIVVEYLGALSVPNYQTYFNSNSSWVNTDNSNANSYSIEATDSLLGLWQGTVWGRDRTLVKAR